LSKVEGLKKVQKNSKKFKKPLDKSEDKWYNVQAVRERAVRKELPGVRSETWTARSAAVGVGEHQVQRSKALRVFEARLGQREALRLEPESIKYSGAKRSDL